LNLWVNLCAPLYRFADSLRRPHLTTGQQGEDRAHRWLRRHGFIVVARNWRPPQGGGEIDIVAWERDVLVFVEVKTRLSAVSAPERAVDDDKMRALRRAARDYIRRSANIDTDNPKIRFDVVTVTPDRLEHLREAFSL
jgi:putative endonuclease